MKKNCYVCEAQFTINKMSPGQKFCSRRCSSNAQHRKKRGLPIKNQFYDCAVCDSRFLQKRANNTKYCSSSCKKLGVFREYKGLEIKGPRKHVKGSGYITNQGYRVLSKAHPNSSKRGQILEHIFIMSQHLGRPLRKDESVHHKNGIRDDNRLENLELWSKSTHGSHQRWGQRVEDKIQYCKEFLEQYGHTVIMKINSKTSR